MNHKKLLVVGELNVDIILNGMKQTPEIGNEIVAENITFTLGSSSAIMASNIATIGVETAFCGKIGNDDNGRFILQALANKNIETQHISIDDKYKTGVTIVMNYDQERANVTYCGAMNALRMEDIPWSNISDYQHLHISNYFLQKGLQKDIHTIFERAKQEGLTTSLDLQCDPENRWDFDYRKCLPFVDVFFPNEAEIKGLTQSNSVEEGLITLIPYANTIALKLGDKGSIGYKGGETFNAPAFPSTNFKDAIGAGDSFNAGFLQKFLDDAPLIECLTHGNLMGSVSTTEAGGTAAFENPSAMTKKKQEIQNNT